MATTNLSERIMSDDSTGDRKKAAIVPKEEVVQEAVKLALEMMDVADEATRDDYLGDRPRRGVIRPTPQFLIATATAFVGLGEPSADGDGSLISLLRRQSGAEKGARWDTALVHHWGYWAHYDHRSSTSGWPVPLVATPDELAAFGSVKGILREAPLEGDVFLQYGLRRQGFVRAGVVVQVLARGRFAAGRRLLWYFDVLTVEGNTGEQGILDGPTTLRVKRRFWPKKGDRFLRWSELDRC